MEATVNIKVSVRESGQFVFTETLAAIEPSGEEALTVPYAFPPTTGPLYSVHAEAAET